MTMRQNAFGVHSVRIGLGDVTDAYNAAIALVNAYSSSGVPVASDPLVTAYQSAWNSTGPTPDTVLTVDGLYGPLTATALQATLNVYNGLNGTAYAAPPANSYASGSGSTTPTSQQTTDITQSAQTAKASLLPTWGWWTLGLVGIVGLGLAYESMSHHPMASAPHKASRAMKHHARRVLKRRGRARSKRK
jgi:hypothetical protein